MNEQPNILILCMDQWQARMETPPEMRLPALERLESQGISLDRYYCHDVMFMQPEPSVKPHPNSPRAGLMTPQQRLSIFQDQWNVKLPFNFEDDLRLQPAGVREYKKYMELTYGAIPKDRTDLWLKRRNYFINAMRMVNEEFMRVLEALDRLNLWKDTVVILTGDHGDMNGAHGMVQKGAIHYDEAALVNFTACIPGGPRGARSRAVGSHLDLIPTLLQFTGVSEVEMRSRYPALKGRSLMQALMDPRWFSPEEYGSPSSVDELYAKSDVTLHDLRDDPGELENIGNPRHPRFDRGLVESLLGKLNRLVREEIGEDRRLYDLDMFGTREAGRKAA